MRKSLLALACASTVFAMPVAASVIIPDSADNSGTLIDLQTDRAVRQAVEFTAGTWAISAVGRADGGLYDAYSVWPEVTGCTAGQNCAKGYRWGYRLVDENDVLVSAFMSTSIVGNTDNALRALVAAQAAGPFTFELETSQTLYFSFSDSNYRDNRGGVSLNLALLDTPSNDVPVPATALLIGLGLIGLARRSPRQ